ncbi:cell wall protein DAN4 [Drosophila innubila]|uniref:cell wall protein DAN4 n=1 Tax=Drosophila innubila TaxID=198719 RepID=UPI00148C5765|nr:cell wall protein DAN4 [Drosophila innubila]XP_034472266.1 cell wall protein DAN4 [Drosophila innubila]
MHTNATVRYVKPSQQLRLNLDFDISNQQSEPDIARKTNLQMSAKNCKNIQQRRGRRRRHAHRGGGGGGGGEDGGRGVFGGGFVGIFWSINLAILICLAHSTNAVPTDSGNSNNSNNNNNSSASSTVVMVAFTPSSITSSGGSSTESPLEQAQPQGQCLLDGLWVAETTVHCEKQTSCRAIQRTGHCCPDYKCDCEKDGKTYANGYKLVDPDTPCTVCYCKGGEIVCSSVTCFRRDDCMPKYVPGRCCPEYDNCPILDNNPSLGGETSSGASTTAKPAPIAPPAGFNWNITIKEITKPTEIRITDDNHKVKQTIPTRKVASTEGPTTAASTTTTTTSTAAAPTTTTTVAVESTAVTTVTTATTEPTATATTVVTTAATAATPTTDTPATPTSSSALSQDTNQKALPVNSSESLKLIASVAYNTLGPQQKPLVTYNADGLQPLAENDPSKVNIKREYTTEGAPTASVASGDALSLGLSSAFMQNGFRDALVDSGAAAAELEPDTAGSDNIYHIISTTEGPSSGGSTTTERQLSTDGPTASSEMSSTYGYENSTTEMGLSTEGLVAASSSESPVSSSTHTVHHMEEDEVPQVESNPAYPSLPEDDFSLRDVNFPLVELEDIVEAENKDEQRSIVSAFERDNKRTKQVTESTLDTSGSGNGSGSGDMELYQPLPSPSDHMLAQGSSISQVPLMYSAEDISAETRIQNVSELAKIRRSQSENETSGELESGSGNGSGSEELREPTTPKAIYVPVQDIDELGSGAGQAQSTAQDPKADAESLKLDESQEQTAGDNKATTRAEKSFVEQSEAGAGVEVGQRLDRLYLKRIY